MDKTIKINLAGTLFQADEEAYLMLRDYLNAISSRIKNTPGGYEAMEDIEARISEILSSQKGITGVISPENVKAVIEIIGRPEDFDQDETDGGTYAYQGVRRRLYRNPDDSVIAGVCGGIGAYLNTDPVWIRLAFIALFFFFGTGFFIYLGLWIALPSAVNDNMKRELHGREFYSSERRKQRKNRSGSPDRQDERLRTFSGTLNEIFYAFGRFLRIVVRIILVCLGASLVLTAFALLVSFVMVFFFRFPGSFFSGTVSDTLFYMPDFMNLVMAPGLTPWVMILSSVVVILPLIAFIYWGLKMIFPFRAKSLVISISALLIWVAALSALVLILVSQGISFAENGKSVEQMKAVVQADVLYIKCGKKISDLDYQKEISVPGENYSLYFSDSEKSIYSKPEIEYYGSGEEYLELKIEKIMHGISESDAVLKAESLLFNYWLDGDTLFIDQYYEIPAGTKWSGSFIEVDIRLPEGITVWIDEELEKVTRNYSAGGIRGWELGGKYWLWQDDRFNPVPSRN